MEPQAEDGSEDYRQLSDSQEKLLAILTIPSAILSIFGSVVILIMAFKSRRKTHWTTYHALLTGISLTEIIFSITLVGRNDQSHLFKEEKKEKKTMERRRTAQSSNTSGGGDASTDTLSPLGSKPHEKGSKIVDTVDGKTIPEQGASMVMMDGSIQSMTTSDDEWNSHD